MKKVNRILDSMISDIDKVKLGLYEASTKRKGSLSNDVGRQ